MHFSEEDRTKIKEAIIRAEEFTTGEVVPVIVKQSDFYPAAHFRLSLLCAFIAIFTYFQLSLLPEPAYFLYLFIAGSLVGFFLGYIPFLKKLFTTKNEMEEEFTQKALESFLMNGVVDTTHRNGVQLYVSALEHKALVLVDKGLKEKLSQDTWDRVLAKLTGPLKKKHYTEGIIAAVDEIGEILRTNFPSEKRTADELPNKLIIDL